MFNFIDVFHEPTVRALEFYPENHPELSETAVYLNFISIKWKILSVTAPYKNMSSFQYGKHNTRVEMLMYVKTGIAEVCSKFDGVFYLITNVTVDFTENIHCGAISSAQFHMLP